VIKSNFITSAFQNLIINKDIRYFKDKISYYLIFRLIRNFLANDLIIQIYNFKIFGSISKNKTSYFLLKKCEFGDYHEMNTLKKFSEFNKIFLLDCGCNYGFYSFYAASLSKKNTIVSVEASNKSSLEFLRNSKLNNFNNIFFKNIAISDQDHKNMSFNESENDWESSLNHSNFNLKNIQNVKTIKIDTILKAYDLSDYNLFIKLDIEGNEMRAIKGGLDVISKFSPIIIIEFSKYNFNKTSDFEFLREFLINYNYQIYDTNNRNIDLDNVILKLNQLKKRYKTIGNYYLIKNSSQNLKFFLKNNE